MKENNGELEEKQNYLVVEIMNKNYDPEKFSEYISNLKENGTDLNNWTWEELRKVVSSFQSQQNSSTNNDENIEKEVENVRNSFIICEKEPDMKLNNNFVLNNENPYDKIFNDNEHGFKNIENKLSDLSNEGDSKSKLKQFEDYEIIDTSEFIDSSNDIISCIKPKENKLSQYNNLYIDIIK